MPDGNELVLRIDKLETESRRVKWVGALLILLLASCVVGLALRNRGRIEGTELVLRDHLGLVVARLGRSEHGTCLNLAGATRLTSAELCVNTSDGSSLSLRNEKPKSSAYLSAGEMTYDGGGRSYPSLLIEGVDGNYAGIDVGEETGLVIASGSGKSPVEITAEKDTVRVQLLDRNGKVIWTAPTH